MEVHKASRLPKGGIALSAVIISSKIISNKFCRIWILLIAFGIVFGIASSIVPSLASESYKGPVNLCATSDGTTIYVVNKDAHEIAVLETRSDKIVKTFSLPEGFSPNAAVLSADEKTLYVVGGGYNGKVLALDSTAGTLLKSVSAGHTPSAAVVSPAGAETEGAKLFVCNQFSGDVSEFSLPDLTPTRTLKVVREPRSAVMTRDGKYLLVANSFPLVPSNFIDDAASGTFVPNAVIYTAAEITVIEIATGKTKSIKNLENGSIALLDMCISPDGRYVYVTSVVGRFENRTSHVEQGWINTAGIAVIDTTLLEQEGTNGSCGGYINTVLIDDITLGAANPWGITTSADGKTIYVATAGTSELIAVDAVGMLEKLENKKNRQIFVQAELQATGVDFFSPYSFDIEVSNGLMFLVGLKKRIPLSGKGARSVTVADGNVYVGMYFSDTLQKLDGKKLNEKKLEEPVVPVTIALGPTPHWTPERRGEVWWNDATLSQQNWQSCASCHLDARMDGINWDLLNDGHGNPKNTKSLLFSHQTPPSMWTGVRDNPHIGHWNTETMGLECVRTGFTWILFHEPDEEIHKDIDAYIRSLKPVPSPYLADGKLSEKAQRGKKIFETPSRGCIQCHPSPFYTDLKMHDIKTRVYYDRESRFDTPTLIEVWRSAPYLHDGRYVNMKDVFVHGQHGNVADLSDEQIDELVEYILSL